MLKESKESSLKHGQSFQKLVSWILNNISIPPRFRKVLNNPRIISCCAVIYWTIFLSLISSTAIPLPCFASITLALHFWILLWMFQLNKRCVFEYVETTGLLRTFGMSCSGYYELLETLQLTHESLKIQCEYDKDCSSIHADAAE